MKKVEIGTEEIYLMMEMVKQFEKPSPNKETHDIMNAPHYVKNDTLVSRTNTNNNVASLSCYDDDSNSGSDCSNDISTAIYLPLATWKSGGICCPYAEMWYSFTTSVSNAAQYTVYTSGSLDTEGYLYDATGALLRSNDDGGRDLNFSITRELTYGSTYYVCVRAYGGNIGSYDIRVDYETLSEEPDDNELL